ncbi:MAG TPA: DUF5700 domain-containing putative Zn-dependent protease, partial [Candidatus Eisenbacteria bacterium]|nr:DUF5700 domain-containing putative Zn-dependent protease [Candidatus Eisenbacteria bacterium]
MRAAMLLLSLALAALLLLLQPAFTFPAEGAPAAGTPARNPDITIVTDEADAALAILDRIRAGRAVRDEDWRRLRESEGYRRLRKREESMGRRFSDSTFAAFLHADSTRARTEALRRTVTAWKQADLASAGRRALAYLPAGVVIRARVYLTIKPWTNSFVFETKTDPAIFLYVDPKVSAAKFENTVAHELHHIGYAGACTASEDTTLAPEVRTARMWMGAFGEGLAMLAAAGGPDVHPHAVSDSVERGQWARSRNRFPEDLRELERFFLDVLERRITDPDSVRSRAMEFFGQQGPWYTVGYTMAVAVERAGGKESLLEVLCDPPKLLEAYNRPWNRSMLIADGKRIL